jgi:hypothetical protein
MSGESLNQLMMVITIGKARLKPPKFMPRVHLGNHQGNNSPMTNAMEGDLHGTHRDSYRRLNTRSPRVFGAQAALFVASLRASNSFIRAITKRKSIRKSMMKQSDEETRFLLWILPLQPWHQSLPVTSRWCYSPPPRWREQFGRRPRWPPSAQFPRSPRNDDLAPRPIHEDNTRGHIRCTTQRNQ